MPKSHPPYPAEFKRRLVELVRAGRNPEELAQKFEPTAQAIRNWVRQADRDDGRRQDGLTTEERQGESPPLPSRRLWRETVAPRAEVYYWRTRSGAEVDFVIEHRRRLLPVELKAASTVRSSDAAVLEQFLQAHRNAACGIVAYAGDEVHRLGPRVLAVPVARLL